MITHEILQSLCSFRMTLCVRLLHGACTERSERVRNDNTLLWRPRTNLLEIIKLKLSLTANYRVSAYKQIPTSVIAMTIGGVY